MKFIVSERSNRRRHRLSELKNCLNAHNLHFITFKNPQKKISLEFSDSSTLILGVKIVIFFILIFFVVAHFARNVFNFQTLCNCRNALGHWKQHMLSKREVFCNLVKGKLEFGKCTCFITLSLATGAPLSNFWALCKGVGKCMENPDKVGNPFPGKEIAL